MIGSSVTCEVTTAEALGPTELRRWAEIRASSPSLVSPFFTSEFTAIVAAARRDARVTVLADGGSLVGFFPFHVSKTRAGYPIGRKLADYQGAIVDPAVAWDAAELVRRSGLRSYTFDHLVASQQQFRPFFAEVDRSPVLELAHGYDAYMHAVRRGGPREAELKARRLQRRFGLRFELHQDDRGALRTLMRWKSEQHRRTGTFDTLSRAWVVEVLERVHATRTDDFAGVLSCLYARDELIAAHLGLRSGRVLHSWFPAYDVRFAKYSPGLVLLLAIAEAASAHGIELFDLGKGAEEYKPRFANAATELGVGSVDVGRGSTVTSRIARMSWSRLLRSPLYSRVHRLRRRIQVG